MFAGWKLKEILLYIKGELAEEEKSDYRSFCDNGIEPDWNITEKQKIRQYKSLRKWEKKHPHKSYNDGTEDCHYF